MANGNASITTSRLMYIPDPITLLFAFLGLVYATNILTRHGGKLYTKYILRLTEFPHPLQVALDAAEDRRKFEVKELRVLLEKSRSEERRLQLSQEEMYTQLLTLIKT